MNIAAILVAGRATWNRAKPWLVRDGVLYPAIGFLGLITLWWIIASFRRELMPTPLEALTSNLDYIFHPFYRRGPGDLGIGWLLLASLRRVSIGFLLGAIVAIPVGFLLGLSRVASLILNPIIQILRPVSPLAWLPIALAMFGVAEPSAIFVIFIGSIMCGGLRKTFRFFAYTVLYCTVYYDVLYIISHFEAVRRIQYDLMWIRIPLFILTRIQT